MWFPLVHSILLVPRVCLGKHTKVEGNEFPRDAKRRQKFLKSLVFLFETPLFFWPRLMTASIQSITGCFYFVLVKGLSNVATIFSDTKIISFGGDTQMKRMATCCTSKLKFSIVRDPVWYFHSDGIHLFITKEFWNIDRRFNLEFRILKLTCTIIL